MTETDARRDHPRGNGPRGAGGGGARSDSKRKRNSDEDELDARSYRNPRPRHDAGPPGTRIRRGLLELGEDVVRPPADQAQAVARLIAEHFDDAYVRDVALTVTARLVLEQPFKIPHVAAVVLFARDENTAVARDVVAQAGSQLQEAVDGGKWRDVKLTLRFLACLGRLFAEDGLLPILNQLFERAVDLQTASTEDVLGIELTKIILLTLPYVLAFAGDASVRAGAAALLDKTDVVASTQHDLEALVDPFPTMWEDVERPMTCASIISLLQRQLQDEASRGWPLKCIPRVYDASLQSARKGDEKGEAHGAPNGDVAAACEFPTITIPANVNAGPTKFFPELFFSIFADQDVETVPPTTHFASTIMRDAVVDTINILDFNRDAVCKFLDRIDRFWATGTFVPKETKFDDICEMYDGPSTWKQEDVCIDAIFGQLFALPAPEHKLVYYHSLITEICKISPPGIAPTLGRAIRFLFRHIGVIDLELSHRYTDWFAHHLSNFEFRWKWAEWRQETQLPDMHPQKAFINGTLDQEISLSFAERIRKTLPLDYRHLVPARKDRELPGFKYDDDSEPFAHEGRTVQVLVKDKGSEEEVQALLDSVHEQAERLGQNGALVATDLFMTAVLSAGSKSISHVLSAIDRSRPRLLALGAAHEAACGQMISSVLAFWHAHPATGVSIVDKLLNYTILTPMSVVHWALVDHVAGGRALASARTYALVFTTMHKVAARLHQVLDLRADPAQPRAQRAQLDQALPRDCHGMRQLFAAIELALAEIAQAPGAAEALAARDVSAPATWAGRWLRMWRRKAAVEEVMVGEAALGALDDDAATAALQQDAGGEEAEL